MYNISSLSKTQSANNNNEVNNSVEIFSDANVKHNFYSTLSFWTNKANSCNISTTVHLIGKRHGFGVINVEHHTDMLKNALSFLKELGKTNGKILFVNDQFTNNLDGIVKTFAVNSGQPYSIEKWNCGKLTMAEAKLQYKAVIILNPTKNLFLIREARKLGIPIISLCAGESAIFNVTYPIICNNESGDSILYILLTFANAIIYGQLQQVYTNWSSQKEALITDEK
ncbi:uS2m family ribosomal protein [uncultured Flavobacterium sp.]|jgi:ribosomal protein S2|uniref:uS2m family ribosomal protein n=1 Tax=uncultured Flavobacterium sp. TaxID=165435 RepID=UPI0030CA3693